MKKATLISLISFYQTAAMGQITGDSNNITPTSSANWSIHAQMTLIPQYHFPFPAKYSGTNSMLTQEPTRASFTSTLYIGRRLWKNAALYFNPEAAGGRGLSDAYGIAGFPNGETFRVGTPELRLFTARLYFEQKFGIGKENVYRKNDLNQLSGTAPRSYFLIRIGKFGLADFFDLNAFSHDPRTQFFNWSLMSNGAWDYPANVRGYTNALQLEWRKKDLAVRYCVAQEPIDANGPDLDYHIWQTQGHLLEIEKSYTLFHQAGTIRLLGFWNNARMGNYLESIKNNPTAPDIKDSRQYGRAKKGFGLNIEQNFSDHLGGFLRIGWNDGKNETWAFTEIDNSFSAGVVWQGNAWKRPLDQLGIAIAWNGISNDHAQYLKAGGYGFIIGDGALNYGRELIAEINYNFHIPMLFFTLSPDYQFILHPAYNKDRGPVHVVGLRLHLQL